MHFAELAIQGLHLFAVGGRVVALFAISGFWFLIVALDGYVKEVKEEEEEKKSLLPFVRSSLWLLRVDSPTNSTKVTIGIREGPNWV